MCSFCQEFRISDKHIFKFSVFNISTDQGYYVFNAMLGNIYDSNSDKVSMTPLYSFILCALSVAFESLFQTEGHWSLPQK